MKIQTHEISTRLISIPKNNWTVKVNFKDRDAPLAELVDQFLQPSPDSIAK